VDRSAFGEVLADGLPGSAERNAVDKQNFLLLVPIGVSPLAVNPTSADHTRKYFFQGENRRLR
jgi:hypothetical protein